MCHCFLPKDHVLVLTEVPLTAVVWCKARYWVGQEECGTRWEAHGAQCNTQLAVFIKEYNAAKWSDGDKTKPALDPRLCKYLTHGYRLHFL